MKNGFNIIMKSCWYRSILVLVLGYYSLSSPIYHIHHSHGENISGYELSAHQHVDDVANESEHHHHNENRSHAEDHQHKYDAQLNWHIFRIQTEKPVQIAIKYFYSSVLNLQNDENKISYTSYKAPPLHNIYDNETLIIRGPPLLV